MKEPRIVSREEWLVARRQLLAQEKELTRARDRLSRARCELPWVRVDKPYAFDGPNGKQTLADLFAGRRQLLVYHFMFDPSWTEGCKSCSFWADSFNGVIVHLNHRDVTMVAVSRAPFETLGAFKARMGWSFTWVSSFPSDFNQDYHVTFTPQQRADGAYSCYARGLDALNAGYQWLDLVPKGRDEAALPSPMACVRHHDNYPD